MSDTFFSFAQGFVVGQVSVCIALFFFIKFFIFGESPSEISERRRRQRPRAFSASLGPSSRPRRYSLDNNDAFEKDARAKKLSSVLRPTPPLTTASILAKTYYNVHGHQPESVDWFNVLVAQTLAQLRNDAQQDGAILTSLNAVLNGPRKPSFLDEIRVTEINLGEEFPIFSNCRVIPVDAPDPRPSSSSSTASPQQPLPPQQPRLQARMDVDLSDSITLGIETKVVLNYPRPRVAIMPVALAVSVVRFSGTLSISFIPGGSTSLGTEGPPTTLMFGFLPDYRLELSTHSLLGSRSRLQDVPKIGQLIEARLHAWFDERCVEPRFQQVALPSFWPRMRNARGPDGATPGEDGMPVSAKGTPGRPSHGALGELSPDVRKLRELKRQMDAAAAAAGGADATLRERQMPPSTPSRSAHHRADSGASTAVSRDTTGSLGVNYAALPGGLPP